MAWWWWWRWLLLLLLLQLMATTVTGLKRVKRIVGGMQAAPPPLDDPVVFVRVHSKNARVEGIRNLRTGLYSFLGVRYATPPTGVYRFQRPLYRPLLGDVNATAFGPPCPQPVGGHPPRIVGSEDCLLLNVYTPEMPDETTGLPVIVWIHGGGFRFGSASQYGPEPLTQKRVILVPVQYRLGTLGILGNGQKEFAGNVAMFDMNAALRWVREYISFFGGDPKNIKVMGQGSGGASAMLMSMSPMPRDSLTGVIAMSGTAISKYMLDEEPVQSVDEIAQIHGCETTNETTIVKCMRQKSFEEIVSKDSEVQTERLHGRAMLETLTGQVSFAPVIEEPNDGRALPGFIIDSPETMLNNKDFAKIPLLTGVTKDETANAFLLNEINSVWNGANGLLEALKKSVILNSLQTVSNATGRLLPVNLSGLGSTGLADLLKIPAGLQPEQIIKKLTEITTDALFSLPALLAVNAWSKFAPSYLYRFEYAMEGAKSGALFLGGLPLVSKTTATSENVAHGDELGLLFDVRDIFGQPISNYSQINSTKDLSVRDSMTSMIAEFAGATGSETPKKSGLFAQFTPKGSPFIRITDRITVEKDFQFCQMQAWNAPVEALNSISCGALNAPEQLLKTNELTGDLSGTLNGVLGGNGNAKATPTKKPKTGGLLALG